MRNILAQVFHNTVGRVMAFFKELWFGFELSKVRKGSYEVIPKPPYISQLANADISKIDGFYQTIHDLVAAERFGAENLDEFSHWAWR